MNNVGKFILISIISLMCGVFLIPVVFLITWGVIDSILKIILSVNNSKGFIFEIFWTLNYVVFYFIVGILAKKYINNNNLSIYFSISVATILIPIVFFLWFFAGFTDSSGKEYVPRILWVFSPVVGYIMGAVVNRKKIINN
jgi:hypothetical protein